MVDTQRGAWVNCGRFALLLKSQLPGPSSCVLFVVFIFKLKLICIVSSSSTEMHRITATKRNTVPLKIR